MREWRRQADCTDTEVPADISSTDFSWSAQALRRVRHTFERVGVNPTRTE
jgi:5-enolpyruvylshikimate-3-phosphate synthase